jgi:hypothetical protein
LFEFVLKSICFICFCFFVVDFILGITIYTKSKESNGIITDIKSKTVYLGSGTGCTNIYLIEFLNNENNLETGTYNNGTNLITLLFSKNYNIGSEVCILIPHERKKSIIYIKSYLFAQIVNSICFSFILFFIILKLVIF